VQIGPSTVFFQKSAFFTTMTATKTLTKEQQRPRKDYEQPQRKKTELSGFLSPVKLPKNNLIANADLSLSDWNIFNQHWATSDARVSHCKTGKR